MREKRSGMRVPGPAVHPNPKMWKIPAKGRRGEGGRAWSYHFPAYHEQRRRGEGRGQPALRARGGRARAATWRSSVPGTGEGGNNNFVNVEVCNESTPIFSHTTISMPIAPNVITGFELKSLKRGK